VCTAWREADLDRPVTGPGGEAPLRARADQQIAELATHDWDLARATGQNLAELAGVGDLLDGARVRRVAHHVADGEDDAGEIVGRERASR
jgi:hypothetical protein